MAEGDDLVKLERLVSLIRREGASTESVTFLREQVGELRHRMASMTDANEKERVAQAKRERAQDEAIGELRTRVAVLGWAMGIIGAVAAATAAAVIRTGVAMAAERMVQPAAMVSPASMEGSEDDATHSLAGGDAGLSVGDRVRTGHAHPR